MVDVIRVDPLKRIAPEEHKHVYGDTRISEISPATSKKFEK